MQLKKIAAIFLAAALILSAFTFTVTAEDSETETFEVGVVAETTTPVSLSPAIYNSGEEVTVTISAVQNTGIKLLQFRLVYNADALELTGDCVKGESFANGRITIDEEKGIIQYFSSSNEILDTTGTIFTATFTSKEDYCGAVELSTMLPKNNDPSYCTKGYNQYVPFVGGSASFLAHNIDAEAGKLTAPKCVENGYTTYHCATCGEDVIGNVVGYPGHTPADAVEENRVEATCTEDGSYDTVVYCSVCEEELERVTTVLTAPGHELEHHEAQEPTCTEIGWDAYDTCSKCDYTTYVAIPPLGHLSQDGVEENRIEPTCEADGSYEFTGYCQRCNQVLTRDIVVIPALGHDYVSHEAQEPTCTEIGWGAYNTCSRCDYTSYVEIPALGHTPGEAVEENRVEATCTEAGSYDSVTYCTVCGDELTRETIAIAALGHTPGEAVEENRVDSACEVAGSYDMVVYCSVCGAELSRESFTTDPLVHIPAEAVKENEVAPTPTACGTYDMVVYCSICGKELSRESFETYILGDTDGDGKVTSKDAINLLYYTLFPANYTVNQVCDFNGDGVVNSSDAVYLLYFTLFGGEQYPLNNAQ